MLRARSIALVRSLPGFSQARGAVCTNIRYIQHSGKEDPMEKYRAKLEQKAREIGASDIDDLKVKLKDTIEQKRSEFAKIDPLAELETYERQQALEAQERAVKTKEGKLRDPRAPDVPEAPFKTLNSYVALEKMAELGQKEIELIWTARFQSKDNALISVVPSNVFDKLASNARENPVFVLPLPRDGEGFELHYVQWAFVGPNTVHCLFTTLLEYKTHKEFARPHTTVSFHTELKDSKGLVLMSGIVEKESAVGLTDAQLLLLNIQRFYGALKETPVAKRRLQLVRDFTAGSTNFTVEKLVEEAQSLEN